MPQRQLVAYVDMMPVLMAKESLRRYQEGVCSSGNVSKQQLSTVKRIVRDWERQANRFARRRASARPKDWKALLGVIGIQVVEEPKHV